MTNRGPGESGYGVLGEANYGSGELVWAALRTLDAPSTSAIIVQDGQRQEHEDASKPATALTEPARSAAVQEIIERESTFQPARNLIADLLAESLPDDGLEKVGNSELMAMVFISAETRQHRRVTIKDEAETLLRKQPILVLSRGRNLLEFIALRKTKIAVEQDEEILYDGHELPGAAQTHYVSDDGPIQQIARPEPVSDFDAPTTVAVRTPHAIQILKPAFRKPKSLSRHHRGAKTSEEASLEPSPLHKIKIGPGVDASGGNIAFNPWDDCQLAYVAADGQWTIWSLRSQVVTAICRSRLISNVLHNSSSDERGGCQITWVLDSNHVLVSYIDTLRVFDLIGRVAATWNLNMRAFGRRMVHMKRSTWDPATIVVTTPSHVLLLNVILNNTSSSIDCALAWRHHLSPTQPLYGIYFLSSHHG